MSKLVLDAGPLITACKFSVANRLVIDHLLDHCQITVAESVRAEVVIAGANYPDARAAQVRLDQGHIVALSPPFLPDREQPVSAVFCRAYHASLEEVNGADHRYQIEATNSPIRGSAKPGA